MTWNSHNCTVSVRSCSTALTLHLSHYLLQTRLAAHFYTHVSKYHTSSNSPTTRNFTLILCLLAIKSATWQNYTVNTVNQRTEHSKISEEAFYVAVSKYKDSNFTWNAMLHLWNLRIQKCHQFWCHSQHNCKLITVAV